MYMYRNACPFNFKLKFQNKACQKLLTTKLPTKLGKFHGLS